MMSKPKYIVILTGLFCSVVASGASHFYPFFPVNILARVDFWYDNIDLWLGKPSPGQKRTLNVLAKSSKSVIKVNRIFASQKR